MSLRNGLSPGRLNVSTILELWLGEKKLHCSTQNWDAQRRVQSQKGQLLPCCNRKAYFREDLQLSLTLQNGRIGLRRAIPFPFMAAKGAKHSIRAVMG